MKIDLGTVQKKNNKKGNSLTEYNIFFALKYAFFSSFFFMANGPEVCGFLSIVPTRIPPQSRNEIYYTA